MGVRAIAVAAILGASTLSIAGAASPCDDRVKDTCSNYPILNPGEAVEADGGQARTPLRITSDRRAKRIASKRGRHARIASAKRKLKEARRERAKVAAVSKRRGARPGVRLAMIAKRATEIEVASATDELTFDQPAGIVAMPRPKPAKLAVAEAVPFDAPTPDEEAAAAAANQAVEAVETTGGASFEERVAEAIMPAAQAAAPKPLGVIPATVRPAEFAAANAPGQFDLTPLRTAFIAFGGLLVLGTVARLMIA
jgi:hypothetical protein